MRFRLLALMFSLAAFPAGTQVHADVIGFDIQLSLTGFTPTQEAIFNSAAATWESYITGYQDDLTVTDRVLTISASATAIDGSGGVLGSAGPITGKYLLSGRFLYASTGIMNFDSADISTLESAGSLSAVILHEMAHVIGIGSLWSSSAVGLSGFQELYTAGSGQYTGAAALAAWRSEFGQTAATYVPVELGGGAGTANSHWDESDGGGNTGIVSNITGRDFKYELMTGWLNSPAYISTVTLGSFRDLGYTVNVVPEPGTVLFAFAICGVAVCRLKRRKTCSMV